MAKNKTKKRASHAQKKKKLGRLTQADLADKYVCYQKSVQSADHEVEFFEQAYRDAYGRRPLSLREDFCGTFAVCCEWVKSHKRRTAVGVDLCPEALRWGHDNNRAKLSKHARKRLELIRDDVRSRGSEPVDVLAAQNFSFWIFKMRAEVVEYLTIAHANLKKKGIMILDMMGGGDCYNVGHIDKRKVGKGKNAFRYEWEQTHFDPITRDGSCHIHFKFSDGSRLNRAFEYHWRFWTVPEVREMLAEAGFSESHVYWEREDENGEDTGEWERMETAENCEAWICYIIGVK